MQYLDTISKNDRMISVNFQGKPFNIMVIQVYAPASNIEEAEVERFHEDLQDLLELTPKKDELWMEVRDIVQETGIKTIPMKKKCKNAKWLSDEALQIAVERREMKSKGEKERYPPEWRVPKNSKEREGRLPQRSMQRNRGKQQNGKD